MQLAAQTALFNVIEELSRIIKEMAAACDPFPSFLGMNSIQAIELEPVHQAGSIGCVVVCPDGVFRTLDLVGIAGGAGISDVEQVEQFEEVQFHSREPEKPSGSANQRPLGQLHSTTRSIE